MCAIRAKSPTDPEFEKLVTFSAAPSHIFTKAMNQAQARNWEWLPSRGQDCRQAWPLDWGKTSGPSAVPKPIGQVEPLDNPDHLGAPIARVFPRPEDTFSTSHVQLQGCYRGGGKPSECIRQGTPAWSMSLRQPPACRLLSKRFPLVPLSRVCPRETNRVASIGTIPGYR